MMNDESPLEAVVYRIMLHVCFIDLTRFDFCRLVCTMGLEYNPQEQERCIPDDLHDRCRAPLGTSLTQERARRQSIEI